MGVNGVSVVGPERTLSLRMSYGPVPGARPESETRIDPRDEVRVSGIGQTAEADLRSDVGSSGAEEMSASLLDAPEKARPAKKREPLREIPKHIPPEELRISIPQGQQVVIQIVDAASGEPLRIINESALKEAGSS